MALATMTVQVSPARATSRVEVKKAARGTTVKFSAAFLDPDGEETSPGVAVLHISFPVTSSNGLIRSRENISVYLEPAGDEWIAYWDSSVASSGIVRWSIKAVADGYPIADDGELCLYANSANTPETPTPTQTILTDEDGNSLTTEDGDVIIA